MAADERRRPARRQPQGRQTARRERVSRERAVREAASREPSPLELDDRDPDAPLPGLAWRAFAAAVARPTLVAVPVLAGVVLVAVFPFRTWMDQRREISATRSQLSELQAQNAALEAEAAQLNSPGEIERRAREQFNLVRPGEQAFAIIDPATASAPATSPTTGPPPPG